VNSMAPRVPPCPVSPAPGVAGKAFWYDGVRTSLNPAVVKAVDAADELARGPLGP